MTYDRHQARQLSTASELALVSASYADSIGKLTKPALRANIARARRLRDKQRDLLRRQRLASRARTGTKHGARPDSNARTAQKAELFDQTLARYTQRLQALEAGERRAGPKRTPGGAGKKRGQAALRQKARSPRTKAIQAHVSSRGRRSQARRDSR
jgi:hypothetical protein